MVLNFTHFKKGSRFIFLSLFLLTVTHLLNAQVKFSTNVNTHETSLDGYFQIDYIIENAGNVENFTPPTLKNFKILQGPSQSENITVINGRMSRSKSISYILQAEKPGSQTIPGAIAVIDGKTMRSASVTIMVNKQGSNSSGGNTSPRNTVPGSPDPFEEAQGTDEEYRLEPNEDANSKIAKNLLVKLNVSKTSCYVGEPFIATYKLYSRVTSESKITKRPSFNGFSVFDMEDPSIRRNLGTEKINGKTFKVHTIRRSQMLPLQEGTYTLDPIELDNKVEFIRSTTSGRGKSRSHSPIQRMMDEFFGRQEEGTLEQYSYTAKSDPVTITVKPLPQESRPADFNGAVGQFTIRTKLQNNSIPSGDAGTLELTIEGNGNIPMINAPHITLPEGMEVFDPVVKEDIDNSVYPLKGTKTITYTFLTRKEGDYTIPPIKFAYFDPAKAAYKTVQSDSFAVQVTKSTKAVSSQATVDSAAIASAPLLESSKWTDIIDGQMLGATLLVLVMVAIIIYLLNNAKRTKKEEAVAQPIPKPTTVVAVVVSSNPLKEAQTALQKGQNQQFYSEINRALREAIQQKTGTLPSELTKFNLPFILREKGVDADTVQQVEGLIKECEIALYTPIHEERDMKDALEKATYIITQKLNN